MALVLQAVSNSWRNSRRRPRLIAVVAALCAFACIGWVAVPARAATRTFGYTGGEQIFTVPAGNFSLHVVAIGGSGGTGDSSGGQAAQVTADLAVSPGQTLFIEVGGKGKGAEAGGAGGFNGGGAGGSPNAGGGGGSSDIRTSPLASALAADTRLIVAAGGGGGGGNGMETGGGEGGAAGAEGTQSGPSEIGGGPGTGVEGGSGGEGCPEPAADGALGFGGAGGDSGAPGEGGAGGGGGSGYFGGGGGGCIFGGAGGGGGSSLVPAGGSKELVSLATAPKVEITFVDPPTVAIISPANGATYTQGQAVTAIFSCTPGAGTGLASCVGTVANGTAVDTTALGSHTFTVQAKDTDGGTTSESVSYTVVAAPSPPPPEKGEVVAAPIAQVKGGKARLKLKCMGNGACAGTARLLARFKTKKHRRRARAQKRSKQILIGSSVFSIPAGSTKVVPVRLTKQALARVRRASRRGLPVRLAGSGVKARTIVLKGPRRHHHRHK